MTERQRDIERLISDYFDGSVRDADLSELELWIEADPDHARIFAEWSLLNHSLSANAEAKVLTDDVLELSQSRARRRVAFFWAAAACLVLMTGFAIVWSQRNQEQGSGSDVVVARVAYSVDAIWEGEAPPPSGKITPGLINLSSGIVKLDFANGAEVTLQGPSSYEIVGARQTRLHQGVLAARVPDQASGFKVATPAVDVVDLGTSFGVTVDRKATTGVNVFMGKVEITPTAGQSTVLKEGEAAQANEGDKGIRIIDYDTSGYDRVWPVALGVTGTTGSVRVVKPGPPWDLAKHRDDSHLILFPEAEGINLTESVPVDARESGQVFRTQRQASLAMPAGMTVRSYLVQFNALPKANKKEANFRILNGQITFSRPIAGVIWSSESLIETDELFGVERAFYRQKPNRGLEIAKQPDTAKSDQDMVAISDDRRTLTVRTKCGAASITSGC